MKRLVPVAVVALTVACTAGGVNPASLIQPDVKLHHLALRNVGLSGGTLDVALAFHNPNKFNLQGTGLTAGVDIEGNHFGDVNAPNAFSLAGKDTTLLTLPLTFRWSGVASAARKVLDYGAVNYTINGKFTVNATSLKVPVEVPFSGQGNVPLLKQ
jgi:LEA14-like dessication related protein